MTRTYETHGAFFGDASIQALHVAQAEHHAVADMLLSGTYGNEDGGIFRGCSVGCFAHEIDPNSADHHETVAAARGLPEWLIHWQDVVFEGLPADQRSGFHIDLARAIPVGQDLTPALHAAAVARLDRILKVDHGEPVNAAVRRARYLHSANEPAESAAWLAARLAAESAAWSAARLAAESAAESAARLAARLAAESAAWSAAESAAWSAAESVEWSTRSVEWSESARSAKYIAERDAILGALRALGDE